MLDDPKRFKARLTARGFTQRPGIDFGNTYAPVCREESWRILICLALTRNIVVGQFELNLSLDFSPCQLTIIDQQSIDHN